MVSFLFLPRAALLVRVRVDERRQGASPDGEPGDESAKLGRRVEIHLKHGDRVRADSPIPDAVNPQLGELPPDPLPQLLGVLGLHLVVG